MSNTLDNDYGYYGKTGSFEKPNLPINNKENAILYVEYDDTVGHKDTAYVLVNISRGMFTKITSDIEQTIKQWNEEVGREI